MEKKSQILAGRKPVLDAIESGNQLEKVIIDRSLTGEFEINIRKICKEKNIPLQRVPAPVLDKYTKARHQGVIGLMGLLEYASFEDTIDQMMYEIGDPVFLVLDQVKDVRNLGAIARSAELLGVSALVMPSGGFAQINDVAIKASAGALLNIPVCRVPSLLVALKDMKLHGIRIVATGMRNQSQVHESDLKGPIALVMGSEEKGVRPHIQRIADMTVQIPQLGQTESFNVSVATGILLYEIARQRNFEIRKGREE